MKISAKTESSKPYGHSPMVIKTAATAIKMPIKDAESDENNDSSIILSCKESFFISITVALISSVPFVRLTVSSDIFVNKFRTSHVTPNI